jgi:hypothetical protein
MGAPSAPRATAARRAGVGSAVRVASIPDGAFFFAHRGVRRGGEVGTRAGSGSSRADSRALGPAADAALARAAEEVVRAARRGRA